LLIDTHLLSRKKDFCRKNLWDGDGKFHFVEADKDQHRRDINRFGLPTESRSWAGPIDTSTYLKHV
jgi:hypothetical protein